MHLSDDPSYFYDESRSERPTLDTFLELHKNKASTAIEIYPSVTFILYRST